MGRYRTVENQLEQLGELQGIISSMKTLAQLELHKLSALGEGQRAMAQSLEAMAAEFLHHYPQPGGGVGEGEALWLLVGSERGFCADFNEVVIRRLLEEFPACRTRPQRVLAVGRKLWLRLEEQLPGYTPLVGASVSEELPAALLQVVRETQRQIARQQATSLHLIYHSDEAGSVRSRRLLPPDIDLAPQSKRIAPLLQLTPEHFFSEFLHHYLYLALTELFSVSLQAENHYRVQHLEGAVRRLDERLATLTSRARALRQEEITEEIEMILLGTGAFSLGGSGRV